MEIDLLIHSAHQLVTCTSPGGPKRGAAMQEVGLFENGALAMDAGKIIAGGYTTDLLERYSARQSLDASKKVVCPGFVDPHTHVVYAGDRVGEFEMRIQGAHEELVAQDRDAAPLPADRTGQSPSDTSPRE